MEKRVIRCVATNGHFVFAFVASRQKIPPKDLIFIIFISDFVGIFVKSMMNMFFNY